MRVERITMSADFQAPNYSAVSDADKISILMQCKSLEYHHMAGLISSALLCSTLITLWL